MVVTFSPQHPALRREGERAIFTVRSIEQMRPGRGRREIADAHLPGFYFIVQPSGAKSWAVRYRHNGRTRKFTLGNYPKLKLIDARELARAAFRAVAEGHDPMAERKEARRRAQAGLNDRDLLETVFRDYQKRHVANLRPSTAREYERLFVREILPRWRKRHLSEISKQDVLDLLDDFVDRGSPTMANHVFATLRTFFNWALHRNVLVVSPCAGIKKLSEGKGRERMLSDDEIRWLWRACEDINFPFGPITKLLVLTGARRNEVRAMLKSELNLSQRTWTIPATRSKNGLAHEIGLTDAALTVVQSVPSVRNKAGYLFSTNGATPCSGFSRAKARLDKLMLEYAARCQTARRRSRQDNNRTMAHSRFAAHGRERHGPAWRCAASN